MPDASAPRVSASRVSASRVPAPGVPTSRVLVLGASGYVGGRLVPRLLDGGHPVRCLVRDPRKLAGQPWASDVDVVAGDLLRTDSIGAAFDGVDVVVHLVHSMGSTEQYARADRQIARTVADNAARAGVRRVVYLGGLGEVDARTSSHLRSRAEVGEILLAGSVPTSVLRAAVVIGSGSASFEMLRHLVENLPVMVAPRWVDTRAQPIGIRDVLRFLVGAVEADDTADHVYDIGGPDILSYKQMMQEYARIAGLRPRMILTLPVLTPRLSSHWIGLVTPVPTGVAKPLVHGLANEVVARDDPEADLTRIVPGPRLGYEEAVRLALRRVRDSDVETSWREADLPPRDGREPGPADPHPSDPDWAGGTLLSDDREAVARATVEATFAAVAAVGGERGWPTHQWAWSLRGLLDQAIGGVGLRRGRRDPARVRVGDTVDFWRVEAVSEPRVPDEEGLLRLRAEMRLPGHAWLEFRLSPERRNDRGPASGPATRLHQRALFVPRGLAGRLYWWAMRPFHAVIFQRMVRALAADAERGAPTAPPRRAPRSGVRSRSREWHTDSWAHLGGERAATRPQLRRPTFTSKEAPMSTEQFVEEVKATLAIEDSGEAVEATRATLATLGERLSGGEAQDLAERLPADLAGYVLERAGGNPQSFGIEEFFERVAERQGVPASAARQRVSAVMAALQGAVGDDELRAAAGQLPSEFAQILPQVDASS